jgi:hypothetical protein
MFDHTSALSTVVNCFGLPTGKLGKRQATAPDVREGLTLTEPRQDRPAIPLPGAASIGVAKRAAALGTAIAHAKSKPLSDLQKRILVGSAKRLGLTQTQQQEAANTQTSLDADAELLKLEAQLVVRRAVKHF